MLECVKKWPIMAVFCSFLFQISSSIYSTSDRFIDYLSIIYAKCQAKDFPAREDRLSNVARNSTKV